MCKPAQLPDRYGIGFVVVKPQLIKLIRRSDPSSGLGADNRTYYEPSSRADGTANGSGSRADGVANGSGLRADGIARGRHQTVMVGGGEEQGGDIYTQS